MSDKQNTIFKIKNGDNIVEITPELLDDNLSKKEGKELCRLLSKQDTNKGINEQELYQISILLARLEINMLSNKTENKTKVQKKRFEDLLSANKALQNKFRLISMIRKSFAILAFLFVVCMIIFLTGDIAKPSVANILVIVSLFVNVFVSVIMIYCKEQIWDWKTMNPVIKVIWWSLLLVNMSFAAKSVVYLWSCLK